MFVRVYVQVCVSMCTFVHVYVQVCEYVHVGEYMYWGICGWAGTHAWRGKRTTMSVFYLRPLSLFETSSLSSWTLIRKPKPADLGASGSSSVSASPSPSLKSNFSF